MKFVHFDPIIQSIKLLRIRTSVASGVLILDKILLSMNSITDSEHLTFFHRKSPFLKRSGIYKFNLN